jgi:DnaK suppressor protein
MTRTEPNALTNAQLAEVREALFKKRDELIGAVADLREPPPVGEPGDFADLARTETAVEERTDLASRERTLLSDVERALAKLDNGTYGLSEFSGKQIPYARLKALPWARNDVDEPSP